MVAQKRNSLRQSAGPISASKKPCHKDIRSLWSSPVAASPTPRRNQKDAVSATIDDETSSLLAPASSPLMILDCIRVTTPDDLAGFDSSAPNDGLDTTEQVDTAIEEAPTPKIKTRVLDAIDNNVNTAPQPALEGPRSPEKPLSDKDQVHSFFRTKRARTSHKPLVVDLSDDDDEDDVVRKPRRTKQKVVSDDESDFAPEAADKEDEAEEFAAPSDDAISSEGSDAGTDIEMLSSDDDKPKKGRKSGGASSRKPTETKAASKASSKPASFGMIKPAPLGSKGHSKSRMLNLTSRGQGDRQLQLELPPISNITRAFEDMTGNALKAGLQSSLPKFNGKVLRVATMCSGTESPLLALRMIQDILKSMKHDTFDVVHLFSAEIVPYKQAYIERNFNVPVIFRDITELTAAKDRSAKATTAYGAKVEVPGDIDLLIAGTACVDYSDLNNKKKSIDDNGESGDTFRAVLSYAKVWRPRMLILENVFGAPWDQMLAFYEDIDYAAAGVFVDTKTYYLPQTRQRGYMFCLDTRICEDPKHANQLVEKWQKTMGTLKRPASSPAAAFMLANDDPAVLRARALVARRSMLDDSLREVDWSRCLIRHIQYRLEEGIGNARPFTSWQESGSIAMPDYTDHEWFRAQVERVWDMLDCLYLKKAIPANGGVDVQYKNRVINVSQNVDRNPDSTQPGILPCLTPSGIFFMTDRGAPLSPDETLALQGLPLDKISFTTETAKEIQDLAGNAMSTTVVGAAILSALTVVPASSLTAADVAEIKAIGEKHELEIVKSGHTNTHIESEEQNMDIAALLRDAASSSQKCTCEGPFDTARRPIQTCQDCGHTTCIVCGGKPLHNYSAALLQSKDRLDPAEFLLRWSHLFPSHVEFASASDAIKDVERKCSKTSQDYVAAVKRAFVASYNFSKLQRGRYWTAIWTSDAGRLELALTSKPTFKLYASCDIDLPAIHTLRTVLQDPVALAYVEGSLLLDVVWKVSFVQKSDTTLTLVGQDGQTAAWRARLNIPAFVDEKVWNTLSITTRTGGAVDGKYQHLPNCGTASNGLYKRTALHEEAMYLMLDPGLIADPKEDSYVFTHDPHRFAYGRSREVLGKLDSAWRPWNKEKSLTSSKLSIHQSWVESKSLALRGSKTVVDLSQTDRMYRSSAQHCHSAIELIKMSVPKDLAAKSAFYTVEKPSFRDLSGIFGLVRPYLNLDQELPVPAITSSCTTCETCMPSLAPLRWKWAADGKSLRPYEDPVLATRLEEMLKARPDVIQVKVNNDAKQVAVRVLLNVNTLAHRAWGKLKRRMIGESADHDLSCSWRVDTNYAETSSLGLPKFALKSNSRDIEFTQPKDLKIDLWEMQRRTLTWMAALESGRGKAYTVEEVEEHLIPDISWRVEAKAKTEVFVKGGIQASHPGFGKTICTLALVAKDYQDATPKEIVNGQSEPSDPSLAGRIKLPATLIIAPKHLIRQWASEVDKVLGKHFSQATVVVASVADLGKHTINNFRNAKIIILNQDLLITDSYVKRLATFAGVPEPSSVKGREFSTWLSFVNKEICKHIDVHQKGGAPALKKVIKDTYAKHAKDPNFQSYVPSKRLKGKAYAEKERDSVVDSDSMSGEEAASAKVSALNTAAMAIVDTPLFEMYHFNRIVVDEFTYLDKKSYASIKNLSADKRWALSATAKLQDPYDIAKMAELIGVRLRIGESAAGALSQQNLKAILSEQTDLERFQTFRTAPSMAVTQRTYKLAQEFLDTFARQNIMECDYFPYTDHLAPVSLATTHRLVYTELSQHLNTSEMRVRKIKQVGADGRDRESLIAEHLQGVTTAEEALIRLAASFEVDSNDSDANIADGSAISKRRHAQATHARKQLEEAVEGISKHPRSKSTAFASWKSSMVNANYLGDEETTAILVDMIKRLDKMKESGGSLNADKMKGQLTLANEKAKDLMTTLRSIRFVHNAVKIKAGTSSGRLCDNKDCTSAIGTPLSVSSQCGHIICENCWSICRIATATCTAEGCRAPLMEYNLLKESKLSQAPLDHDASAPATQRSGAKVQSIISQLQRIHAQGDQAILFAQYEDQIDVLEAACVASGIKRTAVRDNGQSAPLIESFQRDTNPTTRSTVIILNASNSSAAGINLTNANHVLFVSPLLTDSQYDYDAAMAQAVGRVRRPGQAKRIHVYRFVALDTVDVDVLEYRERRSSALAEFRGETVKFTEEGGHAGKEINAAERTQLIRGEDGSFRLVPKSWLVAEGSELLGKFRVPGYEDFSSLVKFSKAYQEDD